MTSNTQNLQLEATASIVSAYVQTHTVDVSELSYIIKTIYQTINSINSESQFVHKGATSPAVPISESVHEDYIICLEDGKKLQMLKRHLSTTYGMTLEQYKQKWNLPHDYPTVAPSYATRRSEIARGFGLGKGRRGKSKLKVA